MKKTFIILLPLIGFLLLGCGAPVISTPAIQPGFDPNLSALQSQQTARAAQEAADLFGQMATGTAQAPIIAITQTAADFQMQQAYAAATSTAAAQTQMAGLTVTAQSWTPTPNATTTAVFAQSYAEATQIANRAIEDNLRIERLTRNNTWKAVAPWAFLLIATIILIAFAYPLAKRLAYIPNPVDIRGKAMPMIEVLNGVAWDVERAANGALTTDKDFIKLLPAITAERQAEVTSRAQMVDMQTRVHRVPKKLLDEQSIKLLEAVNDGDEEENTDLAMPNILLPEWKIINDWDGRSRPLGLGPKGLIIAQAASPHLLTTGGTGSGKTAFMLRTQATASLAKGNQVINIGFSDSGFGVFAAHPNYHSLKLTQSSDVIDCLASVYRELKERKEIIGGESIEWEHWRAGEKPPRPFVDVLIDELGNLADDIYTSEESSKEGAVKTALLWRWMSMIAKEGRKVGIRFIAALQDPTAKSVNLSFRRNCTLVSFQLGDASQSRSFIGSAGAELLQVGYFMTRNFADNTGIIIGGGFSPTDDEIKAYLNAHAAPQTEAPKWLEGVIINKPAVLPNSQPVLKITDTAGTTKPIPDSAAGFVSELTDEKELKVLDLYQAGGFDPQQIADSVYVGDPQALEKVVDLIRSWRISKFGLEYVTRYVLERMIKNNTVNLSQAQREVYGARDPRGGSHFAAIQKAYMDLKQESATDTATQPETGGNTPFFGGSSSNSAISSTAAD